MSLKVGSKVQAWDDASHKCLGWGTVIRMATLVKEHGEIPLIELESGRKIWGDKCFWLEEKKAVEIGVNIFKAIKVDTSGS